MRVEFFSNGEREGRVRLFGWRKKDGLEVAGEGRRLGLEMIGEGGNGGGGKRRTVDLGRFEEERCTQEEGEENGDGEAQALGAGFRRAMVRFGTGSGIRTRDSAGILRHRRGGAKEVKWGWQRTDRSRRVTRQSEVTELPLSFKGCPEMKKLEFL